MSEKSEYRSRRVSRLTRESEGNSHDEENQVQLQILVAVTLVARCEDDDESDYLSSSYKRCEP
jgi:endonuclease III